MIKYSRQREAVRQFLAGRTDHPTAETIYAGLRVNIPNISLGTVYRNLSLLSDTGEIQKLSGNGGSDRFDPNPAPHYHFHCEVCGCVDDIPMTSMDSLNQLAQAHLGGVVRTHTLIFHGTCARCLAKAASKEADSSAEKEDASSSK
jgi:Fur family peroxide stress response transcriptional regulator